MILNQALINFLDSINKDFKIPLDNKISYVEWVEKILKKAKLAIETDYDKIVGLIVCYCNNFEEQKAYISFVGVLKEYRNRKIAKKLMTEIINYVKFLGFKELYIDTVNPVAHKLYKSLGFNIIYSKEGDVSNSSEKVYLKLYL